MKGCVAVMISITAALLTGCAAPVAENHPVTAQMAESDAVLRNPGKGWVLYYPYAEDLPPEAWEVISTCYTRLDWAQVEPEEGQFKWDWIDDAIADCAAHGAQFAFGVMAANSSSVAETIAPGWLFKGGAAAGSEYENADGETVFAPVWNDPVYMEKMEEMIHALAERYDGDPRIAYIDARNCGNWGEWHSLGCSELPDADKARLVDMWDVFEQTLIIVPTNGDEAEFQARYAVDTYGIGIRRDSSEIHQNAAGYAYDKAPAVSEWGSSYALLKACQGWSGVCWSPDLIPAYMAKSKFSYDNLGQWGGDAVSFYTENTGLVREWTNRMGYWFRLEDVVYPSNLGNGATETLTFHVRNDGVAPIYVNRNTTYVRLALLDENGQTLAVSEPLTGVNPFDWKPGESVTVSASFAFAPTEGAASLAIGVFSSLSAVEPDIQFGNEGTLPNGWLVVGNGD